MKPIKKGRILLKNGGHLANLLIIPLHHGGRALKISFNNKLNSFKSYPRQYKSTINDADFSSPTLSKDIPNRYSI
jgi:hypothetical protein